MKPEEHTQWVGAIATNLLALETCLRYFLLKLHKQDPQFPKPGDRDAKKTYMTRQLSLGKIIKNYNQALRKDETKFKIGPEPLLIRDAIAHGRLLTTSELPVRLWKFSGGKKGRVNIDVSEELTVEWMKGKAAMIEHEKNKVVECFKARGYAGLG